MICDQNQSKSVCACTFPDLPSDSSAKGLDDEEVKIKAEFQEVGHVFDTRYVINTKPPQKALSNSSISESQALFKYTISLHFAT